jgi:predicted ATPase
LSKLVDKSFVVVEGISGENGLGYWMLEPVRQYGYERLEVSGKAEAVRRRHAEYYLALVEEAEPELREQGAWLESLEAEHANFRAALGWALDPVEDAQEPAGAERAELGLRLVGCAGAEALLERLRP